VENISENGVMATSSVPNRWDLLQEMVLNMRDEENTEDDNDVDLEISCVVSMCKEETVQRRRCSPSGELISMPNISSLDVSFSQCEYYICTLQASHLFMHIQW
jgi:hypothetical protein